MKGKKFKEFCRIVLGLSPNGFNGEMPDDWNIKILTGNGEEDIKGWDDSHGDKETVLYAPSADMTPEENQEYKRMFFDAHVSYLKAFLQNSSVTDTLFRTSDTNKVYMMLNDLINIAKNCAENTVHNTRMFN